MSRPTKGGKPYDRAALADYLDQLRQARNESFRDASLAAGLEHSPADGRHRLLYRHRRAVA